MGATQERQTNEENKTEVSSPRLTIASANGGNEYLRDEELIKEFGIRIKTHTWDDVNTADILLQKGRNYLANQKAIKYELQLGYVDLSYIKGANMLACGDTITAVNQLQGIEISERIIAMSIDLLQVQNTTVTLSNDPLAINEYRNRSKDAYAAERNAFYDMIRDQKMSTSELVKKLNSSQQQIKDLGAALKDLNTHIPHIFHLH